MSPTRNRLPWLGRSQAADGGIRLVMTDGAGSRCLDVSGWTGGPAVEAGEAGLEALAGNLLDQNLDRLATLPATAGERWLPVVQAPGKFMALGRTFPAHARELGNPVPKDPLVFAKFPENIIGDGTNLQIPWAEGERFDNEVEIGALIGRGLWRADRSEAAAAVCGWFLLNDFTWRSAQARAKKSGAPWVLAKNPVHCLPVGSRLVPAAALPDPRELRFNCRINDEVAQEGDFSGMASHPADLIAWLSGQMPLRCGDVVALGTPKGVTTVRPGDRFKIEIDGLGSLEHKVEEAEIQ